MRIPLLTSLILLPSCLAAAQSLRVQALPSQGAIAGQNYVLLLQATGGQTPYTWRVLQGVLPPGLKLHPHTARITGVPTVPGDYHFTVEITDTSIPQLQAQLNVTIHVISGIAVEWKEAPAVHGNKISGSAVVTNETGDEFNLTVIIVAVNEIGRATALGYQHFKLEAQSTSPIIPFGSGPGPGTYYVRVDAVAQQTGKHHVFRANKQTSDPIKLTQF